ncbi:hypothetical protein AM493_18145 [Flavobacterium akiainvivens]|uniref:DUF4595 domain-containing protein n=1 Tax=Flavobacterium akiainvivens TaxID=1202724 RepID=A0A0N0RR16_9FLAO|nr:hypothetical protein [Flavobacterium akiainvivens]KOS07756.1 hypothetical protein AM493_18145 [Flavobacterium akiainvivens]SFQ25698.1 hypothetical protein SAMN05444144_102210 [Flavobacterium akiainvivens]
MKKLLLLLAAPACVLVSCSDDDSTPSTPNALTLAKTITYEPLESNYNTKRVAYYNTQGRFIADTLFSASGTILERSEAVYTATTQTVAGFDASNTLVYTSIDTFDAQGRIVSRSNQNLFDNNISQFTYNTDGTITYAQVSGGVAVPLITYATNSDGLIISSQFVESNNASYVNFDGGTPSNIMQYISDWDQEQLFASFTYFNVQKPQNSLLSVAERNNRILPQNQLNQVAETHSQYVKSYENMWEFERTFNANNYQTYRKKTSFNDFGADLTEETFFYYNE